MHISMFYGTPDDYVQVTCHKEQYREKLEALGFVSSVDRLAETVGAKEPKGVITPANEDPASPEDMIAAMTSKDAIEAFVLEHYGVDIDKRGSLETVKAKAIEVINA